MPFGASCFINGTVDGDVEGQPGAFEVSVTFGGLVKGDVVVSHMNYLVVQSGTVAGDVRASEMTVPVPFSGQGTVYLPEAKIGGDLVITTADFVYFIQSRIQGDVTITDVGHGINGYQVFVGSNVIRGALDCYNNAAVTVLSPSNVHGGALGQCANP